MPRKSKGPPQKSIPAKVRRLHLPSVDQSSRQLLDEFANPLLSGFRNVPAAAAIVARVEQAARAVSSVWHSRALCERLTNRADALASEAERVAEAAIRSLFGALSADADLRATVFPSGLGASLAARGLVQVAEVQRLIVVIGERSSASPGVGPPTARLAQAGATLADRLATAAKTHAALVDASAAELHQQRAFRTQYHEACGELLALPGGQRGKAARLFERPRRKASLSSGLPPAPRPSKAGGPRARAKPEASRAGGNRAR
jgi:hypothetical protein